MRNRMVSLLIAATVILAIGGCTAQGVKDNANTFNTSVRNEPEKIHDEHQ